MDGSPFTARLDSNYAATDSESLQIQTLLKGPTSRLQELSSRLQELQNQYTQIQDEQSSLLLYISKHRALMSPVRKLPIDILQEIFIACLPTTHNAVMSKYQTPILLTQVCSSWRIIAHATPQLWKSIHIVVPCRAPGLSDTEYLNVADRRLLEAVLDWITRSAACPLDISLSQWENNVPNESSDNIIKYLIRFSERWRQVSLSAPYHALAPLAALPSSKVPLLESLHLSFGRLLFSPPVPTLLDRQFVWVTNGLMNAPKLRELRLTQLNEDATLLPITWSQLTNLTLEGTSWDSFSSLTVLRAHEILSSCQNLISCRMEFDMMTEYNQEPLFFEPHVSLPYLTKFSVYEGVSLSKLFSFLHLPSLDSLEFHTTIWPTQESTTSLLHLLTHSQSTVQHLITDAQFFKRQDFIKCLRLCPLLKSLAIKRSHAMSSPPPWPHADIPVCTVDDAFLKMFTSSNTDSPNDHGNDTDLEGGYLCPNLETFESTSDSTFSEATLLQFIKLKNGDDSSGELSLPGLAKLKTLLVIFHHFLDDINPEHELYKQAGLEATILHPPSPFKPRFSPFDGLPNTNQPAYLNYY